MTYVEFVQWRSSVAGCDPLAWLEQQLTKLTGESMKDLLATTRGPALERRLTRLATIGSDKREQVMFVALHECLGDDHVRAVREFIRGAMKNEQICIAVETVLIAKYPDTFGKRFKEIVLSEPKTEEEERKLHRALGNLLLDYWFLLRERVSYVYNWGITGRIYHVHQGLAERLKYTELSGVSAMSLELPAPNVALTVPPKVLSFEDSEVEYLAAAPLYEELRPGEEPRQLSGFSFAILFREGVGELVNVKIAEETTTLDEVLAASEKRPAVHELLRFFFNAILYTTLQKAEVKMIPPPELAGAVREFGKVQRGSHRHAHLERKIERMTDYQYVSLGKSVPLFTPPTGEIKYTRVMGHWRMQAKGPARSERENIWIEPFWRRASEERLG